MRLITPSQVVVSNGVFRIHGPEKCAGRNCCFHNPSTHSMSDLPMVIRETGLVERTCEHGVGHPDPDSLAFFIIQTGDTSWGIHGCDGCCTTQHDQGE